MVALAAFLFLWPLVANTALASSTTTTTPVPQSTPYHPASKRGLSWANGNWVPLAPFDGPKTSISATYDWAPAPSTNSSFPFVPMLWGCDSAHITAWDAAAAANFSGARLTPDRALLAFNEPELGIQSNCSPSTAATLWISHFEPLKAKGYRLGTPAVTMGPEGKAWLLQWFAECAGGCNPDFLAVHWYDMTFASLTAVLEGYYAAFNLPIWLTEYALTFFGAGTPPPPATQDQITEFMRESMAWLDAQPWVERYFWFGAMYDMQGVNPLNSLLDPAGNATRSGALSALGSAYVTPSSPLNQTLSAAAVHHSGAKMRHTTPAAICIICISWWWYL
ncbi:Alkali-sensitive linkage protein 1 [Vanrija pseudolonga]|uniref:Alkali-sensitive linkage protein 1 n=1 Tax=Vanrija pseudolonga TaxID=143232 RepID=A0AAF0YFB7_9TREE|nr:Alkali-sensitive linkage protein 1 [Vanrija pseudolonga]